MANFKEEEIEETDGSDDLYEHFRFKADKGQGALRVDKYLMNLIEKATRNKIQKAATAGNIHVNGLPVKSNYKVKGNDVVTVLFEHPPYEFLLVPENLPIDIVYEDDTVLVVNKQPGMVVHPGHGNYSGTLINALTYHFENLPNNSSNRPGLVHRIDKDTSGLLVVAKTEEAMTHLAKQFFDKSTEREYVALVWGNVEEDEGTIEGNIGRHPKNRLQNTVYENDDEEKGKPAVTHYKVLERLGYVTFVSCRLETGRTHQIRVHMKYIGHTLFNDERYGGEKILKGTTFTKYKQFVDNCFKVLPRQALHARTLGFVHPVTNEFMRFECPIPEDIEACLEKWRNYSQNFKE
ncbi:RluA family pseudouridine synthase [Aequorivita antarctica]|uniref:Pseudouridine synthase n=1 Tax=Aequorivita antarctica TaxID=153266 RepID=A0A5C6YZH5_9FLAO|nr:RluA family pseudouridine synthase [Aequorivita antarctica]TXD73071.1 RluA family pseudouridine synthase [Aequorivita antarctica]SRX74562.1 Ribosomal large subunit pseudouridine synthase D [Aequorivita antarctica]